MQENAVVHNMRSKACAEHSYAPFSYWCSTTAKEFKNGNMLRTKFSSQLQPTNTLTQFFHNPDSFAICAQLQLFLSLSETQSQASTLVPGLHYTSS